MLTGPHAVEMVGGKVEMIIAGSLVIHARRRASKETEKKVYLLTCSVWVSVCERENQTDKKGERKNKRV